MISLIDRDRQFLKSHYGLDVNEVSRELGFCPHAILDDELTIVEDATQDERFHDNPLVVGGPHVKFYAGAPLIFSDNIRLGTLCIVDHVARTLTPDQQKTLKVLARQVVSQLEMRQTLKQLEVSNKHRSELLVKFKQSETRERSRGAILEKLAKGSPLNEILEMLTYSIEEELEGALCSILLMDEDKKHLVLGAAPNLPKFYNDAVDHLEICDGAGSCGTAAFTGERIIVEDIQNHPYWALFKEVASKAGLGSCWSEPILDSEDNVLGTLAIYYSTPHLPDTAGLAAIDYAAKLAGIAIQRKQEEQSLVDAKRLAEKSSQSKSDFLSSMSHELRTPLNAIIGFGSLLEMDIQDKKFKENAREIVNAGEHLLELINEVLDLSKIEAGKLELSQTSCSLNVIVNECLTLIKPLADANVIQVFDTITNTTNYSIHADHTRFKQVMLNLLSNAIKYNVHGGKVTLACDISEDTHLCLRVVDTGRGLSEQQQRRLFRPFERLENENSNVEGTGIGLVITKRLLELMDGSIGVSSQPDKGCCFWVKIPLDLSDKQPSQSTRSDIKQDTDVDVPASKQMTILYIEDNMANLRLVEQIIEGHTPYTLISARNATAGLELIESKQPDLILMDINLPGMDGYEAMRRLQDNVATKHIPVVAISANAMTSDIEKGIEAGFEDYLTKPLNANQLINMVKEKL